MTKLSVGKAVYVKPPIRGKEWVRIHGTPSLCLSEVTGLSMLTTRRLRIVPYRIYGDYAWVSVWPKETRYGAGRPSNVLVNVTELEEVNA